MRIIAILCSFFIFINSLCISNITVYASSGGDSGSLGLTGKDLEAALTLWLPAWIYKGVGLVLNPASFSVTEYMGFWQDLLDARSNVENSETVEEFIERSAKRTDDGNIELSDDMVDVLYEVTNVYIQEYCGWYEYQTMDYRQFPSTNFETQGLYQAFISYCTKNIKGTDNAIFVGGVNREWIKDDVGNNVVIYKLSVTEPLADVEYYKKQIYENGADAYITQEWNTVSPLYSLLYEDGSVIESETSGSAAFACFYSNYRNDFSYARTPITDGSRTVRVYKSLEDLKSYSVGQRPYFTTSKFQDYDINGDNSCIISESELNGSSIYGDVVNNIITVEGVNGLTEDQLQRLIDAILSANNGGSNGGSSGGSVSGNDGSNGGGLGNFLGGLGSIGDAILSILGKLLEYVGKAVELLSSTVLNVIDIIPKNITALIGGLFPFLPSEWLIAIELGLVLSVILGIVGLFKK